MLPTGKNHISFSEIKNWQECSWRHHVSYVLKVDTFVPNVHVAIGTATHSTLEHFLKTKEIEPDIARKYLTKYLKENEDHEKFEKFDVEKEMKKITSILGDIPAWFEEQFPNWEFFSAEEPLMESISHLVEGHDEVSFKGFIDCAISVPDAKDASKKKVWLIDFKTASRPFDRYKIDESKLQLTLYKKFWSEKHKMDMKDIRCAFVVLIKTAKPGKHCQRVDISVGDVSAGKSLTVIDNFLSSMKAGVKIKNRTACRYCLFKDTEHCT